MSCQVSSDIAVLRDNREVRTQKPSQDPGRIWEWMGTLHSPSVKESERVRYGKSPSGQENGVSGLGGDLTFLLGLINRLAKGAAPQKAGSP